MNLFTFLCYSTELKNDIVEKILLNRKCDIIQVLYSIFNREFTNKEWKNIFDYLPELVKKKIMCLHKWQDRQSKVLGYLLMCKGLMERGYDLESDYLRDHLGRPFVNPYVDFNISHTDGCVVCALTSKGRLGIDIEKIKRIDLEDFRKSMRFEQWKQIDESKNKYKIFYDIWTKKESTLKADGRGLSFPLDKVEIQRNKAILEGKSWFLTKLDISQNYSCHLACDVKDKQIEIKEIFLMK